MKVGTRRIFIQLSEWFDVLSIYQLFFLREGVKNLASLKVDEKVHVFFL